MPRGYKNHLSRSRREEKIEALSIDGTIQGGRGWLSGNDERGSGGYTRIYKQIIGVSFAFYPKKYSTQTCGFHGHKMIFNRRDKK
jgi:hypothetical protein